MRASVTPCTWRYIYARSSISNRFKCQVEHQVRHFQANAGDAHCDQLALRLIHVYGLRFAGEWGYPRVIRDEPTSLPELMISTVTRLELTVEI